MNTGMFLWQSDRMLMVGSLQREREPLTAWLTEREPQGTA